MIQYGELSQYLFIQIYCASRCLQCVCKQHFRLASLFGLDPVPKRGSFPSAIARTFLGAEVGVQGRPQLQGHQLAHWQRKGVQCAPTTVKDSAFSDIIKAIPGNKNGLPESFLLHRRFICLKSNLFFNNVKQLQKYECVHRRVVHFTRIK